MRDGFFASFRGLETEHDSGGVGAGKVTAQRVELKRLNLIDDAGEDGVLGRLPDLARTDR